MPWAGQEPHREPLVDGLVMRGEGERVALRQHHGLRALEADESELAIVELPRRVYGFAAAAVLAFGDEARGCERMALRRRRTTPTEFETQKRQDGSVYLIGFVGRDTAAGVRREDVPANFRFTVYSSAWGEAQELIALRCNAIVTARAPRVIDLDDGEKVLGLDLRVRRSAAGGM